MSMFVTKLLHQVQRYNGTTVQRYNGTTVQRYNDDIRRPFTLYYYVPVGALKANV